LQFAEVDEVVQAAPQKFASALDEFLELRLACSWVFFDDGDEFAAGLGF
jgi:hypothetical protein